MSRRAAGIFAGFVVVGLVAALPRRACAASAFSVDKRVQVSTVAASPTLISAAGFYKKTTLTNSTTYWCLFGDNTTVFSTSASTGTARLTNGTLTLDGPYEPYQGPIYGVCENANAVIDCWRFK